MTEQTPVGETLTPGYAPEEDWLEDDFQEAPPRPRRKLLSPLPVTLFVVLLTACGFLAGVEVEKGQTSSGTGAGGFSGLASLRSSFSGASKTAGSSSAAATGAGFPSAATGGAGSGFPGASGFGGGGATTGEVSFASGDTLYVTNSEGNTVKVTAPAGTTVSKTVTTSVHGVHPGDTVVIRGSTAKDGTVTASSITVSSSGGSSTSSTSSSTATGSATQSLFGAG